MCEQKAEKGRTMKNIDWAKLTDDLLETMVVTQTTLADKCKVTQQSISNWKNGVRSPGIYARQKLRELVKDSNLELDDYVLPPNEKEVLTSLRRGDSSLPEDVRFFAHKLASCHKRKRTEIIEIAEFVMNRKKKR